MNNTREWAMVGAAKIMAQAYDKFDNQNDAAAAAQKAFPHVSTEDMVMMWKAIHAYDTKAHTKQLRIIVAGGRKFNDFEFMCTTLDYLLRNCGGWDITIISGTAKGADTLGEQYAELRGYNVERFPADWDLYGKRAGLLRNEKMALEAGATNCICFWDGISPGTKHMAEISEYYKIKTKVVRY